MTTVRKTKIIAIAVISVLVLIIFIQNTESVETTLLFATVEMSKALLLILMFLAGFVTGIITTSYISGRRGSAAGNV